MFKFIWAHKPELVNRAVMCSLLDSGDLGAVNIKLQINGLRLIHVRNIILGSNAFFSDFFIGCPRSSGGSEAFSI